MSAPKIAHDIALSDLLGQLRHDHAAAAATLQAAIVSRSEMDARVLLSIAAGAVTRLGDELAQLRELLINHK